MKLLLVCGSIAPAQSIASIRWTKIAKYLKLQHPEIHITVLTNEKDFTNNPNSLWPTRKDDLLEKDRIYFDRYWVVADSSRMLKRHQRLNQLKRLWYSKKTDQKLSGPVKPTAKVNGIRVNQRGALQSIKYNLFCLREYRSDALYCDNFMTFLRDKPMDFDVVISSFGPAWTHRVAEQIKKLNPEIKWFADFRDPYARQSDTAFGFWLHQHFCQKHCVIADTVLKVAATMLTSTPKTVPVEVITNGYDPAEAKEPLPPDHFNLLYAGTLYGEKTDFSVLFQAVQAIMEEKELPEGDITVEYCGISGDEFEKQTAKAKAEGIARNFGELARKDAIKKMQKAAILLQLNVNIQGYLDGFTGKAYECMMSKKPCVSVVVGDIPYSCKAQNDKKLGSATYEQCRHDETYVLIKQYIWEKYCEWKNTGNVHIVQERAFVEQFSYPEIAEKVFNLINIRMEQ